ELAVEAVEAGGLACPVRADERHQLAAGHRERDVVDGAHAAEDLGQVDDLEHGRHRRSTFARVPPIPIGKASTRSRISTPSAARQYSVARESASASHVNTAAP